MSSSPVALERAVLVVAGAISDMPQPPALSTNAEILEALAGCILSSRVRHETCVAAVARLRNLGLFRQPDKHLSNPCNAIESALARGPRSHPWPKKCAHYLRASFHELLVKDGSARGALCQFESPSRAREWLVDSCLGVGPKQASLFLRKCGAADELAVLDAHVLRYMAIAGLSSSAEPPTSMPAYAKLEVRLQGYARALGQGMSVLDAAIWVVMRVAARGGSGAARNAGVWRVRLDAHGGSGARRRPEAIPALC